MRHVHFVGRFAVTVCALLMALPAVADWKQAVAYYNQGKFDLAIQELKPDLDKNPDWEPGHRLAGLCYLNLKNNALAISELGRAVQLQSKAFATYRGLAQAYFNSDRLDNCVQTLNQGEQFAKEPADLYDLHHLRGAVYYRQQKYDQAVDDLTGAIRIRQNDWVDFSQLGVAYYNLNRQDEAVQMLQKALALKPGETITSGFLGKTYFRQGVAALTNKQYSQAIDLLHKAGTYTPNDAYVYYNTGEAYLFLNNYPEAEKAYNQALSLLPRNADIYQRLGFLYEKQKKWDQALGAYQKASGINPSPGLKEAIARVTEMKKK
ncbi:MAG: tetratricopeptide repeat protein [Acidobacteriia bacterium]|nr:tetratricopeptide repeat protein [Terriglobia bacterium]